MTDDDRSLERAARSWLEIGPVQAPPRAVDAALLRIEMTPQERDLRILWRFTQMSMPIRIATAAVIGVLAVGGAFYLLGPGRNSNVGVPMPSPTAPTPSPAPSASQALVYRAASTRTLGDWQAMSDGALSGLFGADEHIQLSIDWQDGLHAWIQTVDDRLVLKSATLEAPPDEIHLVSSTDRDAVGCDQGQVGRYRWARTADGMFLTLTAIDDPCANRAQAMGRTWVHSLSAVNDGGLGVYPIDGWLQATLPSVRWGLGDTGLHTFDSGPEISFVVTKDPLGYDQPCGAGGLAGVPGTTVPGTASVTAYADYLRARPDLDATVTDAQVDGHQAIHVELTPKASFECRSPNYALFHDGVERDITPGVPHSLWIIDVDGPTYIIWYEGEGVTPTDELAVIGSLKFLDKLPSP